MPASNRMPASSRPPLSIVVTARHGLDEVGELLEVLVPEAEGVGAEIVLVGGPARPVPEAVHHIPLDDANLLRLRARGVSEARGEIVAIGEDHAIPVPGWCEAVIRAHAESPDAAAIVGCLVNATPDTVAGRGNFLAFAAPWQPPMPELPSHRPPPVSTLSFKRSALGGLDGVPGRLESKLMPELFKRGEMAADDRVVVDHYQDHGIMWSIKNGFDNSRSSYGYLGMTLGPAERRRVARWVARNIPRRTLAEARAANGEKHRADLVLVALIAAAAAAGGVIGTLNGPGRSPDRTA